MATGAPIMQFETFKSLSLVLKTIKTYTFDSDETMREEKKRIRKEESGFKLLVNQVAGGTSKLSSNFNKRLIAQEEAKALEKAQRTRDEQ